jgi:multidrug efflux pump subunit AcrA (membrane-fusion protein)
MFGKKKFWIVLTALAVVLGSVSAYFRFTRPENHEAETAPLQTTVVRQGDILVSASATGTLIAAAQVDLSFKSGGLLTGIFVSVGDEVEKSQLLA